MAGPARELWAHTHLVLGRNSATSGRAFLDALACYDRVAPPTAVIPAMSMTPLAPDKAAASTIPPDQGQAVDMLAAENSKLDARLKTICRGC